MSRRRDGQGVILILRGLLPSVQNGSCPGRTVRPDDNFIFAHCVMKGIRFQCIHPVNGSVPQKNAAKKEHRQNHNNGRRSDSLLVLDLMIV